MTKKRKTHMKRFVCPRDGSYLVSRGGKGGHGRFWGCPCFKEDGCDFSVEFDPPHKAYGTIAAAHDQLGISQEFQTVPTKRESERQERERLYGQLLDENKGAVTDFRKIRNLLPLVHALGLKKKSLDDVRRDLENR